MDKLVARLKELRFSGRQYSNGEEIKRVKRHIQNILIDEEIYWKQRSRVDWLKEGDKSTKYFHAKASSRKRKNRIWGIEDSQRNWTVMGEEVERELCAYFANLFSTARLDQNQLDATLEEITPRVTEEMNDQLQQPFTEEEILEALS